MPPLPVSARPRSPPSVGRPWVVLFLLFAAFAGVVGAAADAGRRRFDIPAGTAVTTIKRAALQAGKAVCVMAAGLEEAKGFRKLGASAFIVSSDQGFMRKAAAAALSEFSRVAE